MRKRFRTFLAAILLSFSSLFATSCTGGSSIAGIRMASEEVIDVPFGNFSYDGIKVTVLFENGGKECPTAFCQYREIAPSYMTSSHRSDGVV